MCMHPPLRGAVGDLDNIQVNLAANHVYKIYQTPFYYNKHYDAMPHRPKPVKNL